MALKKLIRKVSAYCQYGELFIGKMFVWKVFICIYYSFSESRCTKDHPFAYFNGQYCCETNQELVNGGTLNEVASGTCDGIGFSIESTCCKDNEYLECPLAKCKDYAGKDYEKFGTVLKILQQHFSALFVKSNQ